MNKKSKVKKAARKSKVEFWKSRGKWYWRFRAGNGKIVADGAEGYSSSRKATAGFVSMMNALIRLQFGVFVNGVNLSERHDGSNPL
jgi:uncharacterized protein YegP (UPF0339 family)